MSSVRPFEQEDLPRVTSLFERTFRSGASTPAPGLQAAFERILLEHPWVDPEIPSLVYEVDGRVVAFVGRHVRRLRLDGEPIRVALLAQFLSDPDARGRRPWGTLLMRHALHGEQDLSIASFPSHLARMWESLGGRTSYLTSVCWLTVLQPAGAVGEIALKRLRRRAAATAAAAALEGVDRVAGPRIQRMTDLLMLGGPETRDGFPPATRETRAEPLTAAAVVEHLPRLTEGARIRPDYDVDYLEWIWGEISAIAGRGKVVKSLVVDTGGRVLGFYVAQIDARRSCRVLQLVARGRDVGAVVDQLIADARARDAVLVSGRLKPWLCAALWERPVYLNRVGHDVFHTRRDDVLAAILSGGAVITSLEGETWMGLESRRLPGAPVT